MPVAEASHQWHLRQEIDGADPHRFRHDPLGVVTGTEHDAMNRLMEIVTAKAPTLFRPSKGHQITQVGTSLVVSPLRPGWSDTHYREYRFTAARILVTVPPVEKPKR